MARKLSIRKRGGAFEIGPVKHGPTVMVRAPSKKIALRLGKADLRKRDAEKGADGRSGFAEAARQSYRFYVKPDRTPMDTRILLAM